MHKVYRVKQYQRAHYRCLFYLQIERNLSFQIIHFLAGLITDQKQDDHHLKLDQAL